MICRNVNKNMHNNYVTFTTKYGSINNEFTLVKNDISKAIVFGGLEPFDSLTDLFHFVKTVREKTEDDIVIYTGYTEEELKDKFLFQQIIQFYKKCVYSSLFVFIFHALNCKTNKIYG